MDKELKVLLSAFQCNLKGVSEGYLGARWLHGLNEHCNVSLLTGDPNSDYTKSCQPSTHWNFSNRLLAKVNDAIKMDYFYFNRRALKRCREAVESADLLHHVSPVAPRYPVSLAKYSNRFILGPVAGGLRAPKAFVKEVEGEEEFFFKLRNLDPLRFKYDRALKSTYERADKILIAGDYLLSLLPEAYHDKCSSFLDVGIDTEKYQFNSIQFDSETLNLIYVGRVVPYKGLIYLLKAINSLPTEVRRNIRLDIAGNKNDNQYEVLCRDYVIKSGLEKTVFFHGFIDKSMVQRLYEKAHLFCFPSLAEAGGTVVLEAMAKGLPVLAVDYGGPAQSVDENSGVLLEPHSPSSLVEELCFNIQRFFSDRELISHLSKGARIRVESKFDWKVRCLEMKRIYKSVL